MSPDAAAPADVLDQRWDWVLSHRSALSEMMHRQAARSGGPLGRTLRQLARRLMRCRRSQWRQADSNLLDFCLPWLAGDPERVNAAAAVEGFERRWVPGGAAGAALATIAYPLMTGGVCFAVFALFSETVLLEFQSLFREFGLDLPAPTVLLFDLSDRVRMIWPGALAATLIGLGLVGLARCGATFLGTPTVAQWLAAWWERPTVSVQRAAWQLQELLGGTLQRPEAMAVAATLARRRWMRKLLLQMADESRESAFKNLPNRHAERLRRAHGGLLPIAMRLRGEPALQGLAVTAAMAHDRQREATGMTALILGELLLIGVGSLVGLIVISLFMPLFNLISGLS